MFNVRNASIFQDDDWEKETVGSSCICELVIKKTFFVWYSCLLVFYVTVERFIGSHQHQHSQTFLSEVILTAADMTNYHQMEGHISCPDIILIP